MEKLFQLVKSLNGMEKRYFKLAVSIHKEADKKNYMALFDAIAAQENWDEDSLLKTLNRKKDVQRFDMQKNYLYRLLLNTLQSYHRSSSAEQQLINMISRAGILYNKMLYKSCLEILQKARKLAKKYEYYELLLKINQMILRVAMEEKKDVPFVEQFQQEYADAMESINKIIAYRKLYHRLYSFFSKKGNDLRTSGIKKAYTQFLKDPLLATRPKGYEAQIYYYLTYGLCYFCLRDVKKSYDYTQKCRVLIQTRPERITEDPDAYITVLNSVIFYGSVLCKIKESEHAFSLLQEVLAPLPTKQHKIFVAYDNMMALYLTAGLFREGLGYADMAKEELKVYESRLFASNKVSLYHDMFYIYFGCRKYEEARQWLNKLLNETTLGVREDIQVTARITNLILHYELGNYDLLPYLLRRTYSFMISRKRLHKLEKVLLKFIGKLLRSNPHSQKEIKALFAEIKYELDKLVNDPDEAMVLTEYFDYISWLESKISGRPFERIVKEKAGHAH